jgi:hypothetical protein
LHSCIDITLLVFFFCLFRTLSHVWSFFPVYALKSRVKCKIDAQNMQKKSKKSEKCERNAKKESILASHYCDKTLYTAFLRIFTYYIFIALSCVLPRLFFYFAAIKTC